MRKPYYILLLFFITCLGGCKKNPVPSSDYMVLDEISYIHNFPETISLNNGTAMNLDILNPIDLSIHDSLLIITTPQAEGMWSFLTLPDCGIKGRYLSKGRGPNEFLSMPVAGQQYFFKQRDQLHSIIYDFTSGKSYDMNVTETIQHSKLNISETEYSLPHTLFGYTFVGPADILCREVNEKRTMQTRYILKDGIKKSSANIEKINLASIRPGEDINILSVLMMSNPTGDRIVEVALGLNQINLYSLDDSFGKTICVGNRVDNIDEIQDIEPKERIYTYLDLNVYPNFFGALYLNDTMENYELNKADNPVIQFFDWEGKPLSEIRLDRMITTYDIDFINGTLYTLNYNTEEIFKYDIRDFLDRLLD